MSAHPFTLERRAYFHRCQDLLSRINNFTVQQYVGIKRQVLNEELVASQDVDTDTHEIGFDEIVDFTGFVEKIHTALSHLKFTRIQNFENLAEFILFDSTLNCFTVYISVMQSDDSNTVTIAISGMRSKIKKYIDKINEFILNKSSS